MCNEDIINLDVGALSDSGFCFLWVLNSIVDVGYKCLASWGYEIVDTIFWAKTTQNTDRLHAGLGYYFQHSAEMCLVGVKNPGKVI